MNIEVKKNKSDWKAFYKIRSEANFINYSKKEIKIALKKSLFKVVIYFDKKPIAIGRVIGDGKIAFFLKDIIVDQKYQKMGIGKIVVENLLNLIYATCANYAYIGLMSTPGKEEFYQQFGFIKRPTDVLGSGMVKFYERKK